MKEKLMKMLKSKKIWMVILLLVIILMGFNMLTNSDQPRGMMVTTSAVTQKDLEESLTLKAPLEGRESVEVVSNLHYEVLQINVQEGDKVAKGDVLAVLDQEVLQREFEEAQDALELATIQSQEKLKENQRAYEKALENLEAAQLQYDRNKVLADHGGLSQASIEQDLDALNEAKRLVNSYNVKDGKVILDQSEAKNLEMAQKKLARKNEQLSDTEIKSPIDGTVTRVNTRVGRFADDTEGKKPMFVIENLEQLQMKVEVSEYEIDKIAVGQAVEIGAEILNGEVVKGVVNRISPTGEQKSGTSSERVIPIQIEVLEQHQRLIAGITAKAKILIDHAEQVLVVPIEALRTLENGQVQVAKVESNQTMQWVDVTVGLETDLEAEIQTEALKAGDVIILSPDSSLTDGSAVQVLGGVN